MIDKVKEELALARFEKWADKEAAVEMTVEEVLGSLYLDEVQVDVLKDIYEHYDDECKGYMRDILERYKKANAEADKTLAKEVIPEGYEERTKYLNWQRPRRFKIAAELQADAEHAIPILTKVLETKNTY